jgi:membrane protease YdiL (CAAX protease family)
VGLILLYIWVIEPVTPAAAKTVCLLLLAAIPIASILVHHEGARQLGFRVDNFRFSAMEVGAFTLAALLFLGAVALWKGNRSVSWTRVVTGFLVQPFWGFAQQFALQAFVHRRLRQSCRRARTAAAVSALLFGLIHAPNPVLVPLTLVAGYVWCRLYNRTPNLYTLALSHGWLSTAVLIAFPNAWVHQLRVGPDFWHAPGAPLRNFF